MLTTRSLFTALLVCVCCCIILAILLVVVLHKLRLGTEVLDMEEQSKAYRDDIEDCGHFVDPGWSFDEDWLVKEIHTRHCVSEIGQCVYYQQTNQIVELGRKLVPHFLPSRSCDFGHVVQRSTNFFDKDQTKQSEDNWNVLREKMVY